MLSNNLKRSVAAFAVTAGLLVAAGPANAAWYAKYDNVDGSVVAAMPNDSLGLKAGQSEVLYETVTVKTPETPTANGFGLSFEHLDFVNAPTNARTQAAGTQVGSEGVKVPIDDMDLSNHAVRSPESTEVAMEKTDTLDTRTRPNFFDIPADLVD